LTSTNDGNIEVNLVILEAMERFSSTSIKLWHLKKTKLTMNG